MIAGIGVNTGIVVATANPPEVGPDRIVNSLAAMKRHSLPAIVVDFGTATTFDAVSAALGLLVVATGAVVAFDGTDAIDTGWWLALGALVLGLGLIPWTRTRRPDSDTVPTPAEPTDPPPLRL